tara:strand:+ start:1329 stop:1823 length:495 start_codon:yes stop_codon:yes gene_type:complete
MADDKWTQPAAPPPPLFTGQKEKDLVKQVNDELLERVIGQVVVYYPISLEHTNYHALYGEAVKKTFLPPVRVHALVEWEGNSANTTSTKYGIDKLRTIKVHFHKRRLTEDQDLFVREGDFILYGNNYYEITFTRQPTELFGQNNSMMEIVAECIQAREGTFDAN